MTKITIDIPDDILELVDRTAANGNVSRAYVIEVALKHLAVAAQYHEQVTLKARREALERSLTE